MAFSTGFAEVITRSTTNAMALMERSARGAVAIGVLMIFGFFSRLFGEGPWELDQIDPPWGQRPSIFVHVQKHIVPGKDGLAEGGDSLPDEAEVFEEGGLRWVSGGLDGAFGHHWGGGEAASVTQVFNELKAVLRGPTNDNVAKLYATLKDGSAIESVDSVLELLANDGAINPDRLHELSLWLAKSAADREPVKVALAVLGILQGYEDREVVLTLARHEEFTLYAAVALSNQGGETDRTLWELARQVDGWGRIQ